MRSVASVGRWSTRHPWRAIGAWLAFVVVAVGAGVAAGTAELGNGAVGESARGYDMMSRYGAWPPTREYAYLRSTTLRADDPAFRAATAAASNRLAAAVGGDVDSRVSPDRHAVLLVGTVQQFVPLDELRRSVLAVGAAHPQITVEQTGDISASVAREDAVDRDLQRAELLSIPVTLLVLLFAFGAVVAALVPVVLAMTGVIAAFGLLGPLSQAFPIDDAVKTVMLLIGMAVGVDYALFYVIRSREERHRGLPSHEALERTIRTSGRTVIVSGTTVVIAMAGMFVIGSDIFNALAAGTIAVVACAVAGSVTVLPGVLELLGRKIDRGRIPYLPHLSTDSSDSRFWPAVIDRVLRRPVLSCLLSAGLLVALALPALSLHVGKPSDESLASQDDPVLASLGHVRQAFPSTSAPAILVVAGPLSRAGAAQGALGRLEKLAVERGIAHPPFTVSGNAEGTAASVELPLTGAGDDAASKRAVRILREELVPQAFGSVTGVETAITGVTAEDVDFTGQMKHGAPYVIAFVLAFLLLLVAFRSLVIPLKAVVLNLLSVGAAYGILALVFEHGWAEPILGFTSNGTIISWLPIFLFVVLFGLSMDYHVFILSRIREAVDEGMPTDAAVRYGITVTAGVVTSAALVMVAVFSLFGTLSSLEVKQAGVGLAAAVLIDATIIRAVLLPATMTLLGDWNWYLPHWLEWLPRASLDEPVEAPQATEPA